MTISYTYGYIDARTRAIGLLQEAQSDIAEGATVKDRLQELSYSLLDIKPNIDAAIAADHLADGSHRDRLLPDNEDYRKGYAAGYSDAYGDVSALKAKLNELRGSSGDTSMSENPVTDEMFNAYVCAHKEAVSAALSDYSKIATVAKDARLAGIAAALNAQWQDISTAPKDGTEILMYREDCGVFLARWISPSEFVTDGDTSDHFSNEDEWYEPDWFGADFIAGYRVSNDGDPTHWMPLTTPPSVISHGPNHSGSAA